MFWYIVICMMMLYPFAVLQIGNSVEKRTERVALISACFILWFFMVMRDIGVGVDTKYYAYVFTQFSDIPIWKVFTADLYATEVHTWTFDFEPGYRLLNKVLSFLGTSPQIITMANSTLVIILLYFLIRNMSPDYLMSVWLFITLGVYQTEMNVTRNAIAILIVYNAFVFIEKGRLFRYVLSCLLASMFHVSAIIFIPFYFVFRYFKMTKMRTILLVGSSIIVGVFFNIFEPIVQMIVPSAFERYFTNSNDKMATLIIGLLNLGVFVVCYWLLNSKERANVFAQCSLGIKMLVMNLCFFGLNIGVGQASRMAALFGPYMIIFIPQSINLIENRKRKQGVTLLIILLCGGQYVMRLGINNIGGTLPYRFFW